jgi:hypothetical protein
MATNTTKSIGSKKVTDKELNEQIAKLGESFAKEKKRKVTIPKALEKNIGTTLEVGINGVFLVIPVGQQVEIPETFADHVQEVINNITT